MSSLPIEGKVFYFGSDNEFSAEIRTFFTHKSSSIICEEGAYSDGALVSLLCSQPQDIIIIDFSEPDIEIQKVIKESLFVKRNNQHKPFLLVALFKNEYQKKQNHLIFSSGFQLSFIKGAESEALFRDCYYIGFKKSLEFPFLALAGNINLSLEIGMCSTLTQMDKTEFVLETDLMGLKDKIKTSLTMFPDLKCSGYEIKEKLLPSNQYPLSAAYLVAIPLAGPWVDDSEENIQSETVETWLENSADEFLIHPKIHVRVYTNESSIIHDLYKHEDPRIHLNCGSDTSGLDSEILKRKPDLIFFDLDDEISELQTVTLKKLEFLLSISMEQEYKPIVIVGNCKSKGQALQKAYNYPLIVSSPGKLNCELALSLIQKFQAKRIENDIQSHQFFKAASEYRSIDVVDNCMITSLTEHEITFVSNYELPILTVLHFKLPIEFHATRVPTIIPLSKKGDKFHYMAFIHGLTEEELMVLRKFVNQIIYSPIDEFTGACVMKALGEAFADEKNELLEEKYIKTSQTKT